ncbi:MAG: mechanosensitive ion channel [Planctomycetes bacterium]|nr:mechanosensitive ion channel [Planctomycetota bacterium]
MPDYMERLMPLIVEYATSAAGALLLLIAAWVVAGVVSGIVRRSLQRTHFDDTLSKFFVRLVWWLIVLAAIVGCLGIFGVETTSFAAVIGAAGLAVGLAFQGTLANFASGVMLLAFRPFKVGDVVTIAGQTGVIDEISVFTTTLDTFDNRRFIIPNSSIFGTTIENITYHPRRRADVDVGVSYDADIDRTREVLERATASVEGVLQDPAPAVLLLGLGASSVDWSVRVWAKKEDFGAVKQAMIRAVKRGLDEAGIGIPYPQMDVHLSRPAE